MKSCSEPMERLKAALQDCDAVVIGADFLKMQDEYLQGETAAKGITDIADLTPVQPGL